MREDFTPYEIAYLCGGPERVAMVALAGLHADGQIKITRKGHRVVAMTRTACDPVETAVFDALPNAGCVLGTLISRVSESAAVMALRDALVEEDLTGAGLRHAGLRRAQRRLQTHLRAAAAESGPARIAALGSPGLSEPALRDIFETPDPPPFKLPDFSYRRRFPSGRHTNAGDLDGVGGNCGNCGSCGGGGGSQ